MAYLSLYRKYRSQTFEDLIGQEHVVRTLQNAIRTERIAQAYLFTGPRGTGKTSSARLLAKCLNCQNQDGPSPTPCNHCEMCVSITQGNALDVLEMDAASESGVDEVRQNIIDSAGIGPMIARYKVYIIDEVHDLSLKAFDALLKTIEEPPAHLVFILATTEAQRVPPTIRSRCQKFEFHRATMKNLSDRLTYVAEQEGVRVDPPAITAIARMADGGYRDALTLLEQAVLVGDGHVTLESVYDQLGLVSEEATDALLDAMRRADVPGLMQGLEEIARQGRDPRAIVESMLHRLADLTRASYDLGDGHDAPREASLHATAMAFGRSALLALRGEVSGIHRALRDVSLPRLWLESELVRIALKLSAPAQVQTAPPIARELPVERVAPSFQREPATGGTGVSPVKEPNVNREVAETVAETTGSSHRRDADATPQGPFEQQPIPDPPLAEETEPEPEPVVQHAPDNDPRSLFDALMRSLDDRLMHKKKLAGAQGVALADGVLTISLAVSMNKGWFEEKAERRKFLRNALLELTGRELDVAFVAEAPASLGGDREAVELPLEGRRLADTIRQVFGEPDPS